MTDLINRTDLLAELNQRIADTSTPIVKGVLIAIKSVVEQMPRVDAEPKWIPLKWMELTEEEKEYYGEEYIDAFADCPLPDDGDEILISKCNGKWVNLVVFSNDEFITDESGNDWVNDVDAWMPLPRGYVKEDEE